MYIKEKISHYSRIYHIYFNENIDNPKSYISYLLLKQYYQDLDTEFSYNDDWEFYFIVRRHFLRKMKKLRGGHWICHYCHKPIYILQERNNRKLNKKAITIDHKLAIANGGNLLDTKNMVECCYKCNKEKKTMKYEEFIKLKANE